MNGCITPKATLQQVLQGNCTMVEKQTNGHVKNTLLQLQKCRTAALGYHVYRCSDEDCGKLQYQYHSCRNRHCPQCGGIKKQDWIEARIQELLPVPYYHVVFTLPHELNAIVMGNQKLLYKLLFDAAAQTLLTFAADKKWMGAVPGIIAVLHTWGQQLSFHPHVHCIVSGGGICKQTNTWKPAVKNNQGVLFAVKAMGMVYKTKFLQGLQQLLHTGQVMPPADANLPVLIKHLYAKDWVVYAKAPFAGPQAVIEYLGRYTHKAAISNHRIGCIDREAKTISFAYKDYADGNTQKQMTLGSDEFIRRFAQHILPKHFTKIRTYGYLANRNRHQRINAILQQMKLPQHKGLVKVSIDLKLKERFGINRYECPCCKKITLELLKVYCPWKQADDG
jgi:Putative transposase/Transposase zinc-binding domain